MDGREKGILKFDNNELLFKFYYLIFEIECIVHEKLFVYWDSTSICF